MLGKGRGRTIRQTFALAEQAQAAALAGDEATVARLMPQLAGSPKQLLADVGRARRAGELVREGRPEEAREVARAIFLPGVTARIEALAFGIEERLAGQVVAGVPNWIVVGAVAGIALAGLGAVVWWGLRR